MMPLSMVKVGKQILSERLAERKKSASFWKILDL